MKLQLECVKDILEELEELPIGSHNLHTFQKSIDKYGEDDVIYTLAKLSEAEYINADVRRTMDGRPHIGGIFDLTFAGHEFLNSIRLPGTWERIKGAAGEGGTACLKAIGEVALELFKEHIRSQLSLKRHLFSFLG